MGYLLPTEYVAYGLTAETSDDWVTTASALIDAHCRRTSLLAADYVERLRVTSGSQTVRVSYLPVGAVTAARARYAKPRRGEMGELMGIATVFGLPGSWSALNVSQLDVDAATGEVTLPSTLLGLPFDEVELTYTAGLAEVPATVKAACAQIVKNAQATPGLNVKRSRVDTMQMEYFSGSLLDAQVLMMLRPYVATRLG